MAGELILLVDDEPNNLSLARLYLERGAFQDYLGWTGCAGSDLTAPSSFAGARPHASQGIYQRSTFSKGSQ